MKNEWMFPVLAILLVLSVFSFVPLTKSKTLDCSKGADVYYLKPSEFSSIQPILKSNPNAVVIIPETNELRANTELITKCPEIDLTKYIRGLN